MGLRLATGPGNRTFAPIATTDGWLRCSHTGTTVARGPGDVTLAWTGGGKGADWPAGDDAGYAGLAFAADGCLYRGDPERGQIQRAPWQAPAGQSEEPVDLLASSSPPGTPGGFTPVAGEPWYHVRAVALGGDEDGHLFVLDGVSHAISILDLADGRLVGTVALPYPAVDLAADGRMILVALASRDHPLVVVDAFGGLRDAAIGHAARAQLDGVPADARPARVAVGPDGERWLLLTSPASGWAVPIEDDRRTIAVQVTGARDIELDGRGRLVVAGPGASPGQPVAFLRRWVVSRAGDEEDVALSARGYDGRGIVRTPDGRIGFWNGSAFRIGLEAARRFQPEGFVDCHGLDSGTYRQVWGRVFVEACVPPGTSVEVGFATSDDEPDPSDPFGPSIAGTPLPVAEDAGPTDDEVPPFGVPPLVPAGLVPVVERTHPLHRRETGSERPWVDPEPGDLFEVYEAPVHAEPGRYLWLRVALGGTPKVSPRVRAVRVELPGHDLLSRLPRVYSQEPVAASFLRRFLAMPDGLLWDLEARAADRHLLFDPDGAPAELLPWLASLIGLTLDRRWPEPARRTVLAEAICLFRRRGTMAGLLRLLEIYLGCRAVIVESWRMRGAGGADLGDAPQASATSVVGFGMRVGGEVGGDEQQPLTTASPDAFATHAHRFSVFIPRDLTSEQMEVVADLLELERPAHTLCEICAASRGMRVGIGLHVELSTIIGPTSTFAASTVGGSRVGTGTVLGRPRAGIRTGGARVGKDTVMDP